MATKKYQITQLQEDDSLLVLHPETSADIVLETEDKKVMTSEERTKLQGIEDGAQVNKIEVIKVNGTPVSIASKEVNIPIDYGSYIPTSEKGSSGGVATLGTDGKIPETQLPSYVDDVLEFTSKSVFPAKGESGKIYTDTTTNLTYRWSGTQYIEISPSIALGETSSTAYPGDKGKANASAITALQTRASNIESKNSSQDTEITNIKNGTTKVGKASTADTCTGNAATATKLANARTISVTGDASGSTTFDGSANKTITLTLGSIGTAGTYSVVTTDSKGRVISGGQVIEVGTSGQKTPSAALAVGGIFYKEI